LNIESAAICGAFFYGYYLNKKTVVFCYINSLKRGLFCVNLSEIVYFWKNLTQLMAIKLLIPIQSTLYTYLSVFLFFFCSINVNAQCAGNDDNTLNVCVFPVAANKTIDLGARLGPHTAGGTWKDDDFSGGLDVTTGILNAEQISRSGIYTYTYTVNNVVGCIDNSATVTVTIGPNAGVGSKGNTCSDDTSYNLFQAFDIAILRPQINGAWYDDDGSGGLSGSTLNATIPVSDKTYHFTYIVSGIGGCTQESKQQIEVSIVEIPKVGTSSDLELCSDQLSSYTNYNLNRLLSGQDPNGIWSQPVGINEISGPTDSTIDIQNIYNTKGPGKYSFSYTVTANGFCPRSSTVDITIEKLLDYTGATLTVNAPICENEIAATTFSATLKDVANIPDGTYAVTYTISGNGSPITKTSSFSNNVLTFPIDSNNFSLPGDYTVTVTNIVSASTLNICHNIIPLISGVIKINPIPKINAAKLTILPVCQTDDATVNFSGTSNLTNGDYDIIYNLSGTNTASGIPAVLSITGGGSGSFIILKGFIPNVGMNNTIVITKITNKTTNCTNTSTLSETFTVNPLPDLSNLIVTIKDVCQGQPATVKLTGLGVLTSIAITYNISNFNTVVPQTIPLTVVAGETSFKILATAIPIVGLTTFTITNVTNTLTGCSISTRIPKSFTVNPIPVISVTSPQLFCTSDNATVANLMPQGSQYKWFDSAIITVPLVSTTPLVAGNYYVKEVNALTGCESSLETVAVIINLTPQINSAALTIRSICQGFNANVNFTTGTTNLTDGNYDILYNLSGSNTENQVQAILSVTSGMPSFTINSNLIPKAGNTTVAITKITNSLTGCSNTSTLTKVFVVNALPDVSNMVVTVKDGCLGQPLNVQLSGLGALTNITLSYAVSGANNVSSQTIPLVVSSGNASFLIPAAALSTLGNNTLIITDLTNTGNSCATIINSVSKNFAMNVIPSSPSASNQEFCETNLTTVGDLTPKGNQYKWYNSITSTTPLASSALLVTSNYFLKEGSATTGCESNATPVNVLINTVPVPVLNPSGQDFCGVDKPTIQNLSNNTTASGNLTWYDAETNGTQLVSTDLLKEGFTYYGFDSSTVTNCSSFALAVTVSLTDCTATPENFFIPDGFSPNGDGVNETFQIIDIEFLFPNYTLEIFNRYGNVLFKGDINKPAWDGKNSNTNFINGDTPTGVYFYVIHYNKDNLPPKQGQLYLNR
jgi:gliding motility-associated-like protein